MSPLLLQEQSIYSPYHNNHNLPQNPFLMSIKIFRQNKIIKKISYIN